MSGYEIVDCHIHPAVDEHSTGNWFGFMKTVDEQFEALKNLGVSKACGAPIRHVDGSDFAPVRDLNNKAFALRERYPEFYVPGITIHPNFPDESCREIDRCVVEGAKWIGELVGYCMGYGNDYTTQNFLMVMEYARDNGCIVNFHCGENNIVREFCAALPGLDVVLAHPMEAEKFTERMEMVSQFDNLYLDISGSGIDRYGMVTRAMENGREDKILFGSDFPINNPAVYLHGAIFEGLDEILLRKLFAENFKALMQR